jgi:hypothetical protein
MREDRAQQESGEKKERTRVTCEKRLKGTASGESESAARDKKQSADE